MYHKILVPVDGSDPSNRGVDEAIEVAKKFGSRLKLVHVVNELVLWSTYEVYAGYVTLIERLRAAGTHTLETARSRVQAKGIEPEIELVESFGRRAAELIIQHAADWGADLIVLGTHGRRGVRRWMLGSDAEMILRMSPVPVLLVRPVATQRQEPTVS